MINQTAPDEGKRRYNLSLRSKQAEQTRELILQAAVELIAEEGLQAFAMAEVARRAGVSLRTVWRNFPNFEALMDAVDRRLAKSGPRPELFDPGDPQRFVDDLYEFFDGNASPILALLSWRLAQPTAPHARSERLQTFIDILTPVTGQLSPDVQRAAAAAVALLPNSIAWGTLRKEFGWSAEESAEAVGRILKLVFDDLHRLSSQDAPGIERAAESKDSPTRLDERRMP